MPAPRAASGRDRRDDRCLRATARRHAADRVLSGAEAGRVWRIGDIDAPETIHLYRLDNDHSHIDFTTWVDLWLELFGA